MTVVPAHHPRTSRAPGQFLTQLRARTSRRRYRDDHRWGVDLAYPLEIAHATIMPDVTVSDDVRPHRSGSAGWLASLVVVLRRLWARNYRSLANIDVAFGRVTVIQGLNGSGKTNIYRALSLLSRGASGGFAQAALREGGMPSMLWAGVAAPTGRRRPRAVRMVLGITVDELSYELAVGLPNEDASASPPPMFFLDAQIKEERAWFGPTINRHTTLLDRSGVSALARTEDATVTFAATLDPGEPALAQLGEPGRFPELWELRETLRRWRFYHSFPTDDTAPARRPRPGVRTSVLADDGHDLAAALATIADMGSADVLNTAVEQALGGARLHVRAERGTFTLEVHMPGVRRPMTAGELSDGTLRFLCLAAALLTQRPPPLLVFNEPETSLHRNVIAPLADLVIEASEHSQIVLTTHSDDLAGALVEAGATHIMLTSADNGATTATATGSDNTPPTGMTFATSRSSTMGPSSGR